MRKRFTFSEFFFLSLVSLSFSAQVNGQTRSPADKPLSKTIQENSDSIARKRVNLVYYKMPSHLTAASTAAVYGKDLLKSPVANVLNALTGRLSGVSTNQSSGLPGSDAVSLSLRGQSPIVFIDGIARSLTSISLEEIESVTVVKDALGAAMLGVRGSRGALLITTKQGSVAQQRISFTAQTAIQQPQKMPKALNAYNYALLRNEAVANEALSGNNYANLLYTNTDLQAYQDGSDPLGHPDVDWRKAILKSNSRFNRYSLNASGGSSSARYFVALEHFSQDGLLKTDNINTYNTNNYLKSYEIRSNVDLNINSKLSGGIHLLGRLQDGNQPGATISSVFSTFLTTPANAYPILNPNGTYGGVQQYQNNLYAQATGTGYQQAYNRDILADIYLKRTLDELSPGLYIKALGSYSSNLTENIVRSKPFVVSQRTVSSTGVESYTQYGTAGNQVNTNNISFQGRQSYLELSLGYNHKFDKHGFDVLVMANQDNTVSNSDLPYTISGTSGKVSYNYDEKYIAEAAYGYNGSNRYPGGKTEYGFFPAFGLAWNVSKEDFLKEYSWLNALKLSGSYGKVGNDNPGYFSYIQRINDGAGAIFGSSAGSNTTKTEATLANPNITWEKANKLNLGLQGTLFNEHLGFNVEYYNNKYYDLLIQRGKNTALLGNSYPNENIGINRYKGFDFDLSWQGSQGKKFNYFIAANAGIQQSEVVFSDEVNQPYAWMYRTGQQVGQAFGYTSLGLFQSQTEINGAATFVGYTPQPGDIRYKDLNSDGLINQLDQSPVGSTKPLISYGLNLGFSFMSFDFSALVQGVTNRNIYLSGNSYWEFQSNGFGQAYEQHLNRWTPATAATATYPRLSIGGNTNNQVFSSYWFRKADYMRLKNVELGFTLPAKYSNVVKLQSARIFVNGTNLLTSTELKEVDPEVFGGNYPLQRMFNVGINVKL